MPPYGMGTNGTAAPPCILQSSEAQSLWINASQVHRGSPGLPSLTYAKVPAVEGQRPPVQFDRTTLLLWVKGVQVGIRVLVLE